MELCAGIRDAGCGSGFYRRFIESREGVRGYLKQGVKAGLRRTLNVKRYFCLLNCMGLLFHAHKTDNLN